MKNFYTLILTSLTPIPAGMINPYGGNYHNAEVIVDIEGSDLAEANENLKEKLREAGDNSYFNFEQPKVYSLSSLEITNNKTGNKILVKIIRWN